MWVLACAAVSSVHGKVLVDFEDLGLEPNSSWSGAVGVNEFSSGPARFSNTFDAQFGVFTGWAYSNQTDVTTPGFTNPFSSYAGSGANGSRNFGVVTSFDSDFTKPDLDAAVIRIPEQFEFSSAQITNTTYAALSMLRGDMFAKKFGGESGADPDFFLLKITGKNAQGSVVGVHDVYLADYRGDADFLSSTWMDVPLTTLRDAVQLSFNFQSSDVGMFGMNTPAFAALDDLALYLRGDVTDDGSVGIADFAVIRQNFNSQVDSRLRGDLNADGMVNLLDFQQLRANFGATARSAVPEPSLPLLPLLAITALLRHRRA